MSRVPPDETAATRPSSPASHEAGDRAEAASTPAERVELRAVAALPSVEILLAENCARRWQVLHNTYTVCTLFDVGRPIEWKYRNQLHDAFADTVAFMEPGEVHANTAVTAPASLRVLMIDPGAVERAARELNVPGTPHFKFAQVSSRTHPAVQQAFRRFHGLLESSSTSLEIQSHFANCLRLLLEQCAEATPRSLTAQTERRTVQRAKDFIAEHLGDNITLADIVEAAGSSSQFQLIHTFSAVVGLPPHAYQIQLRIQHARALLAAGVPLAQVAADLGFVDQSHLSRHFTRVLGVPPGSAAKGYARK